ncbi:BT_3928 family protein [Flammeovirga agarivorans]|uniref:DoxX family protein n=1 Tax=Flammeovirga agarivorans TaxID=2726742 RepID=A0A7X8SH59_9BACT|nr:BT_3928 family protein [Flammeovirga agarivorans]NLR90178.1 DoxX family protein [Flammeovirga agarivorans]
MRVLQRIFAILVGLVFMVSGFVKIDDPMGTAIKFEEYFHVFADDMAGTIGFMEVFFNEMAHWSLILSVLFSSFEFILGVALVVNYKPRLMQKATLALLVFFGFLTFYSAYFDKVTDCGCFGDAIKFSPWGSFTKDIILLVLLLVAMVLTPKKKASQFGTYGGDRNYTKDKSNPMQVLMVWLSVFFSFGLCYYALEHLPPIDFRPYQIGANIEEMMKPQAPCVNVYYMEKDGEEKVFETYPTDPAWKFKRMEILNEDECKPLIPDYYVSNENGDDLTEITTTGTKLLIIVQNVSKINFEVMEPINKLIADVSMKDVKAVTITSDASDFEKFRHDVQLATPYYYADATVLKAMIRSNPGVILVKDGTILGKWHYNDTPTVEELTTLID